MLAYSRNIGFIPCTATNIMREKDNINRTCSLVTSTNRRQRLVPKACDSIYVDDPYGGFKGIRKSQETDAWVASGAYVVLPTSGTAHCRIFVSSIGCSPNDANVNILVLPGYPCPSYMTRRMCRILASRMPQARIISMDWPGVGESDAPQDGLGGFRYGLGTAIDSARAVVQSLALARSKNGAALCVVGHGYIATNVAATVAKESGAVGCVLLAPAVGEAAYDLPDQLRKVRNPIFGPLLTGNPSHMADSVFSSASPYAIEEKDMMVLRSPFLRSGGPGFAARAILLNNNWRNLAMQACDTIRALECPVTVATASEDRWLSPSKLISTLESLKTEMEARGNKHVDRIDWKYSGHFIFEDAPEDVAELIDVFISRML